MRRDVWPRLSSRVPPGALAGGRFASFSWLLVGNTVYAASQWALVISLARIVGPGAVGQFALALAIVTPVYQLSNLSLRTVQMTDRSGDHFRDYMGLRLLCTLLALVAITVVCAFVYPPSTMWIIVVVGIGKGFDSLSDVIWGERQRDEQMAVVGRALLVNGVGSLLALTVVAVLTESALWSITVTTAVSLYVLVVHGLGSAGDGWLPTRGPLLTVRPRFSPLTLRPIAMLALPLGVATALTSLYVNIPRYILQREYGNVELGVYAAVSYLIVAGNLVMSAAGQATLPRLSRAYLTGDRERFQSALSKLALIGTVMGLAAMALVLLAGREILLVFYGSDYTGSVGLLRWLTLAGAIGFMAWFSDYGISAARRFRSQLVINVLTTVLIAVLSFLLIPDHGAIGAAWALAAAMLAQSIVKAVLVVKTVTSMPEASGTTTL